MEEWSQNVMSVIELRKQELKKMEPSEWEVFFPIKNTT